jgi:hypothetical protein
MPLRFGTSVTIETSGGCSSIEHAYNASLSVSKILFQLIDSLRYCS